MGPGGADSVQKYNLMVVRSSLAANILDYSYINVQFFVK